MNNSQLIQDSFEQEGEDVLQHMRERGSELTDLIEALSNISQSSYWTIIEKELNRDLKSLVSRLEKEKETVEIFRLQGEIKNMRKYNLKKTLAVRRKELEVIKKKLNEK